MKISVATKSSYQLLATLQEIIDKQPFERKITLEMGDLSQIWGLAIKERMTIEHAVVIYVGERLINEGLIAYKNLNSQPESEDDDTESPEPIILYFRCSECGGMMELHLSPESKEFGKEESE